jgi:5-(aminomethyl)-3-furanmethanol phosphate kinase
MISAVGPALVLKLGGSLAESRRLTGLAEIVAGCRAPVVVVPGGGPFADGVRAAQAPLGLAARHPRFVTAETLEEIARVLVAGAIPVWLPFALQHADDAVPADWTATSDALAARLAERMGCGAVALVKSCAVPAGETLTGLTASGIVDPVFGQIVTRARLSWTLYGAGDEGALAQRLG